MCCNTTPGYFAWYVHVPPSPNPHPQVHKGNPESEGALWLACLPPRSSRLDTHSDYGVVWFWRSFAWLDISPLMHPPEGVS